MKHLRHPITLLSLLCMAFAVALFTDLHPFLRGGFGWRWPYNRADLGGLALVGGLLTIYCVGGWWLLQRGRWMLLWAFAGSLALTIAVVSLEPYGIGYTLFTRAASLVATGPHHAAATLDFTDIDTLRTWDERILAYDPDDETVSRHVLLAPPGIPLLYEGLNVVLGRLPAIARPLQMAVMPYQCWNYSLLEYTPAEWASAWFGMLAPLWAALTAFPLWGLARRLRVHAGFTVLAWGLVPAIAAFAGSWNTLYPLLTVIAFYLFHIGLERGPAWIIGGGLCYGLLTFLNFAPVPLGLIFGFYTLIHYVLHERDSRPLWRPLAVGGWFALGTFAPWIVWMLIGGPSPLAILEASFTVHLDLDRPYFPWLFLHTYDWALFAGLPLVLVSLGAAFRPRPRGGDIALALWLSLAVIVLSGTARAETARVWSIFTPFVLLAAAGAWEWTQNRSTRGLLLVSTAAMCFALVTTWDVFDAIDMKPLPTPPSVSDMALQPISAGFDDEFSLVGWGATAADGIQLNVAWESHTQTVTPYWFAALWVGPDGATGESVIWQGGDTTYPTTCWSPGEVIYDTATLPLPDDAASGDYWLSLSVFADEDAPLDRLTVTFSDGTIDSQVGVGPVQVE